VLRNQITQRCVKILASYRKHVAASSAIGQLILPESFKLFPLSALALIKSKALCASSNLSSDERNYHFKLILQMSPKAFVAYFYPRMVALHVLDEGYGTRAESGRVLLPPSLRLTYDWLEETGIYLIGTC